MTLPYLIGGAIVSVMALLCIFATLESAISQLTILTLRVIASNPTNSKVGLLDTLAHDRDRLLLPLRLGTHLLLICLIVLVAYGVAGLGDYGFWLVSFLAVGSGIAFIDVLPSLFARRNPERTLLRLLPLYGYFHTPLAWLSAPLHQSSAREGNGSGGDQEETTEEEIQAFLDVGEEEGIIEHEESALINSALHFGDTLVREIMTPRATVISISEKASIQDLLDLMISKKHSRIPVVRENIDHIVGVVYVRNLLGHLEQGKKDLPITPLINKSLVVPETKRVLDLLKEMQRATENLAIVVNEYGSVSGLVTIEDLVEEIVGEIYDEDESHDPDVVFEEGGSLLVKGRAEVGRVEEAIGIELGDPDVTTLSGLVVNHLGTVPKAGKSLVLGKVKVTVVSADPKRIRTLRLRVISDLPNPKAS